MATVSTKCNGTYGSHYTLYLEYTLNSQNISNNTSNITVKMYAKSDSSSYGAYNTSAVNPVKLVVGGSTKVDKKIAMDFRSKKTVNMASWTGNVTHGTDGKLTIKLEGSFSISGTSSLSGGSISKSWTLTTIPRASSVTCADGNIGSATTININRASSSFTHTISYSFGGLTGTIATKTTYTSIGWTIPTSFFAKIPNAKSGQGTITCQTYSGSTLIGTKTCTFNAFVIKSEPTVDATVVDINEKTIALTGDANKIVKYFSNAQVDISATAKNSATISSRKVVCGGKTGTSASNILNGVESGTFVISCTDSRGFSASKTITKTLVEYIKLAFTNINLERPSTTSNTVNISLTGNYFNSNFGNEDNSLSLKFRYRVSGGEFGDYTVLSPTISNNTISLTESLGDIYDFNNEYEFELVATDKLMTLIQTVKVSRGIPIIDIGEEDMAINERTIVNKEMVSNYSDLAFVHNNGSSIGFGVGTGKYNRGIYDVTGDKWLLYANSDNHLVYSTDGLYSPSSGGVRFDQYGNIILNNYNDAQSNAWSIFQPDGTALFTVGFSSGSITIQKGILYHNGETIRCKQIYDSNNVTNATNMYITSNGYFRRTSNTSSKRYKTDIKSLENEELDPNKLYDLEVKQFKYKEEYQPNKKDSRYNKTLIGFIAEEMAEIFPIAVDYTEEGEIDNWNEKYMIPAMLKLIQDQKKEIEELKNRVSILERKE